MSWFASSLSANMRKKKATRKHVIAEVSRMFQLSWLKYLDKVGSVASRSVVTNVVIMRLVIQA